MLTLTDHPDNRPICNIVDSKRKVQSIVLWHPRRDEALKNEVEDVSIFNTPYLRDRFEISKNQADSIFEHLRSGETDTANQKAFFRIKKYIDLALFTEMDLTDGPLEFEVRFDPDPTTYSGHELVVAGTGAGKSYYLRQQILRNLKGPKRRRRKFIVFSAEWEADKTLRPLKALKYMDFVTGVDCGDAQFRASVHDTEDQFFENEIVKRVDEAEPGTVIIFDDAREIVASNRVRHLIDKLLRVGRHQGLTLKIVLHNLRSGAWSTQAYSSVRYLTVFPRSQKAKIVGFFNKELGLPLSQARDHVFAFSQAGRVCMVRFHAPECLIGPKLLRLL